jgi:hypothetical protein
MTPYPDFRIDITPAWEAHLHGEHRATAYHLPSNMKCTFRLPLVEARAADSLAAWYHRKIFEACERIWSCWEAL